MVIFYSSNRKPKKRLSAKELTLSNWPHFRWPKYWSVSFSISLSNEYPGLISFRIDWFDLAVQRTLKVYIHIYIYPHPH